MSSEGIPVRFVAPLRIQGAAITSWFVFVRKSEIKRLRDLIQSIPSESCPQIARRLSEAKFKLKSIKGQTSPGPIFGPHDSDIQELELVLRVLRVTRPHGVHDRKTDYEDLYRFKDALNTLEELLPRFCKNHSQRIQRMLSFGIEPSEADVALSALLESEADHVRLIRKLLEPKLSRQIATWHDVLYLVFGRLEAMFLCRGFKVPPLRTGTDQPSPFLHLVDSVIRECNEPIASAEAIRKQIQLGRNQFGSLSRPVVSVEQDKHFRSMSDYYPFPK